MTSDSPAQDSGNSLSPTMQWIEGLARSALEQGVNEELLEDLLDSAYDQAGRAVAQSLRKRGPKMVRRRSRYRHSYERRLYRRWRSALDLFEMVVVACLEAGETYHKSSWPEGQHAQVKAQAMVLLHARACLVASEVSALLRSGHAAGAQARWRTMHELATVASVLGTSTDELSQRYLSHSAVERRADALCYQENCKALSQIPFTQAELDNIEADYQKVLNQYEEGYKEPWGWAKPLFAATARPSFVELERLAGLDHNRPYVRLSHHAVHSGATGAIHIEELYGRGQHMLAGPSDGGLAEPGHGSLIALFQVTTVFLMYGHGPIKDAEHLIALKAIQELLDDAGHAFEECSRVIDEGVR